MKEEKSGRIMLLREDLDNILMKCGVNITDEGEDVLKQFAKKEEKLINYDNLFFKTTNRAKSFNFLK